MGEPVCFSYGFTCGATVFARLVSLAEETVDVVLGMYRSITPNERGDRPIDGYVRITAARHFEGTSYRANHSDYWTQLFVHHDICLDAFGEHPRLALVLVLV